MPHLCCTFVRFEHASRDVPIARVFHRRQSRWGSDGIARAGRFHSRMYPLGTVIAANPCKECG